MVFPCQKDGKQNVPVPHAFVISIAMTRSEMNAFSHSLVFSLHLVFPCQKDGKQVSSPGEFRPKALPKPDVNLSAHPAPIIQSFITPICQCLNSSGLSFAFCSSHFLARSLLLAILLYFFLAHFCRALFMCFNVVYSADFLKAP